VMWVWGARGDLWVIQAQRVGGPPCCCDVLAEVTSARHRQELSVSTAWPRLRRRGCRVVRMQGCRMGRQLEAWRRGGLRSARPTVRVANPAGIQASGSCLWCGPTEGDGYQGNPRHAGVHMGYTPGAKHHSEGWLQL